MTTANGAERGEVMIPNPIRHYIAKHNRCYRAESDGVRPSARVCCYSSKYQQGQTFRYTGG